MAIRFLTLAMMAIMAPLLPKLANAQCSTCSDSAVSCFEQVAGASDLFLDMVTAIQSATVANAIDGTAFFLDRSINDPAAWEYQKQLAGLVALTQDTLAEQCNTFYFTVMDSSTYHLMLEDNCKSRCDAFDSIVAFNETVPQAVNPGAVDWWGDLIYQACGPTEYLMSSNLTCDVANTNLMGIAVINGKQDLLDGECSMFGTKATIDIGTDPLPPWATAAELEFKAPGGGDLMAAMATLQELNQCIISNYSYICCGAQGALDNGGKAGSVLASKVPKLGGPAAEVVENLLNGKLGKNKQRPNVAP